MELLESFGKRGKLILLPALLDLDGERHIPIGFTEYLGQVEVLVCERPKTARQHIRIILPEFDLSSITYRELSKKSTDDDWDDVLNILDAGQTIGYMSEAGIPCVADPGSDLVRYCHERGHEVIPLSGPSSIFMALMSSGLTAQQFCFVGYLGIKKERLIADIRSVEKAASSGVTQIFIETPYRNNQLLASLIKTLDPKLRLAVSVSLSAHQPIIKMHTIHEWRRTKPLPDLHKRPTVFILGR